MLIMIQQHGSSLLLVKLQEFVVSRVTEMTNPTECDEKSQESGENQEGNPDLPVWPHQLCQVPHSDLYFQNTESSALEGWRKVSCAFLKDARPPVLLFCSSNSCCFWQLLGECGVVVPVFIVEFGGW